MIHYYSSEFESIQLRPLEEADLELLRLLRNKNRHFFINKNEITADQQSTWFKQYLAKNDDIMFAIRCPTMGFAGAIALYDIDFKKSSAVFGRIVVSENAPRFTGTYAIEALLLFARNILKIKTITCSVLKDNQRAIAIYERVGFCKYASEEGFFLYQKQLT